MSVERQSGSSHLHHWDIHLSRCLPSCWSLQLFPWCRNIRQVNYEVIANISSQLYSVECGGIFLPVNNQGYENAKRQRHQHVFFFIKMKTQSFKEIEVVTDLIATALYPDRTDPIPTLTFSNTACCIQLHSWSINPKCIQLLDKHLTSYYLYFPNLNIHEMLNFVRVWVWCNKRRSCYFLDFWLVWSAMKIGYKQLNQ